MSDTALRAILLGAGSAGTEMIKTLHARNIQIVAAADPAFAGEDVGTHADLEPLGVRFDDHLNAFIDSVEADIAVVAVATELDYNLPIINTILEHGIDVVTIAEEGFNPWTEAGKAIAAQLDATARSHNVSVYATGMQDLFWLNAAVVFSAGVRNLERITILSRNVLDGASTEILDTIWVGKTVEEFNTAPAGEHKEISTGPLNALATALGLTPISTATTVEPIVAKTDHRSEASDVTVPTGRILGTREVTTVETEEGVTLSNEFQGKLGEGDEADGISLTVEGEPNLGFTVNHLSGFENTAAIAVSRIPDVIAAHPGYLLPGELPLLGRRPSFRYQRN